jgi:peptidyl-prolyl cis-trans isomerase C
MISPRRVMLPCLALIFAATWSSCAGPVEEKPQQPGFPVLAWVDGDTIYADDLREFESALDPVHRSDQSGVAAHREHLESFFDIMLMGNEAVARGLDRDPVVAADLEATRRQAVVEAYIEATVGRHIQITEQELIDVFESSPYSMSVLPAHIVLPTRESAQEVYAELLSGRSFAELAKERSIDRATAVNGGAFDRYFSYDEVSGPVLQHIFDQPVGGVTEPFRTVSGYEIGKVLDRRRVDFERYRSVVQRVAVLTRFKEEKKRLIGLVVDSLNVLAMHDGLKRLSEIYKPGIREYDVAPADGNLPVYKYAGGELLLKQALALLSNMGVQSSDMNQIDGQLRTKALTDLLLLQAASRAGFGEKEGVKRRVEQEQRKRLLKALWAAEIDSLAANDEDVQAHYRSHPELYQVPHETVVQEILVATEAEALDLMGQIKAGGSVADLARDHSLRLHSDEHHSVFFMRKFETLIYGKELMQAAAEAAVEELVGPVRVNKPLRSVLKAGEELEEAFSIFKVLERREERLREFAEEESQRLAFYYAGQDKRKARLEELVADLRRRVSDKLVIDDPALQRYAAEAGAVQ